MDSKSPTHRAHPCLAEINDHEKNAQYQYVRCATSPAVRGCFSQFVARFINKDNHKRSVLVLGEFAPGHTQDHPSFQALMQGQLPGRARVWTAV